MEQEIKLSRVYNANKASVQQKVSGFPIPGPLSTTSSCDSRELVLGECASLNVCREASELLDCEEGLLEGLLRPDCADPVPTLTGNAFLMTRGEVGDVVRMLESATSCPPTSSPSSPPASSPSFPPSSGCPLQPANWAPTPASASPR